MIRSVSHLFIYFFLFSRLRFGPPVRPLSPIVGLAADCICRLRSVQGTYRMLKYSVVRRVPYLHVSRYWVPLARFRSAWSANRAHLAPRQPHCPSSSAGRLDGRPTGPKQLARPIALDRWIAIVLLT
ncbi:hypothetical protein F4802DRAFT_259436 [Xylaria palmicola]|nr:hypothetical protein F4802DRAFT_259436 [Xylaria palmicola]